MTNTGNLALHGLSLFGVVALGAGLWAVAHQPPPTLPAAAEVKAPTPDPRLEDELRKVRDELASLQSQIAALRQERDTLQTRLTQAPAATSAPADKAPAAALQSALDDPRMRETIQAAVDSRLKADQEEQAKQREQRWEQMAAQRDQQRLDRFAQEAGLNDTQKDFLGKVSADYRDKLSQLRTQLRDQVRQKTLTADQAKTALDQVFAEIDAKAQGVLNAEQMKQYRDMQQRAEEQALRFVTGQGGPGGGGFGVGGQGRRGRQSPTP